MAESDIYGPMMIAASRVGSRLFRNQVGLAVHREADGRERKVRTGLATGSADLIGWTPLLILPEHVGRTLAVFTSVEAKPPGWKPPRAWADDDQAKWMAAVRAGGGFAGVARSIEEELEILRGGPGCVNDQLGLAFER